MPRRPARDLSVGVVSALALVILALAIMAVGGQSRMFSRKAQYRVIFHNTDGLRTGSPVRMAGVQVGSVAALHLPTDPKAAGIEVLVGVETAYAARVREGSTAALRWLQFLSGEKYVEITPGNPAGTILPAESVIPVQEETQILEKGQDIADNLSEITVSLKEILAPLERGEGLLGEMLHNPDFGKEGLAALRSTLENLDALTGRLRRGEGLAGRLLVDKDLASRSADLSKAIGQFVSLLESLNRKEGALGALTTEGGAGQEAIVELRDAARSLKRTAQRLENREGLLGRLMYDGEYSERVAADLRETLRNLAEISKKVNSGEGTLGALVNERTLHDGMEEIVAGTGDSKFARWLLRHYQKKGIKAEEPPPSP